MWAHANSSYCPGLHKGYPKPYSNLHHMIMRALARVRTTVTTTAFIKSVVSVLISTMDIYTRLFIFGCIQKGGGVIVHQLYISLVLRQDQGAGDSVLAPVYSGMNRGKYLYMRKGAGAGAGA